MKPWNVLGVIVAVLLSAAGCSAADYAVAPAAYPPVRGIERATDTSGPEDGRFSDPYPLETSSTEDVAFSGTFKEVITCRGAIEPGCFTASPISVTFEAGLEAQIEEHGLDLRSTKAHHITHASDGRWEMVLTAEVVPHGSTRDDHWNLILHAHPARQTATAPADWTVDSILAGSLDHSDPANYDGKYFQDGDKLYLLYSKSISTSPVRFGIAAQLLDSPSRPAATPPVMLLAPSESGLASENYFSLDQKQNFRLVETGNVLRIDGKYVMLYSVGSYQRPTYKIALAYSDTFLPADGRTYRKVFMTDTAGVWGESGAQEVDYLLQSQEADWPHYAHDEVQAPGVGSLIRQGNTWYLFFAGYDPAEEPEDDNGTFAAAHRRPYYLPIQVRIPAGTTVAQASDHDLASWITP